MKKEDIHQSFDLINNHNKSILKWLPIVGGILSAIGGTMYFLVSSYDARVIALLILGLGAFCLVFLYPIIYFESKKMSKKINEITSILDTDPKKLVWSYIYTITKSGVKSEFVVMKFKDGQELQVFKAGIKNHSLEEYLYGLRDLYNPNMVLGFSEELNEKYLNGQL